MIKSRPGDYLVRYHLDDHKSISSNHLESTGTPFGEHEVEYCLDRQFICSGQAAS